MCVFILTVAVFHRDQNTQMLWTLLKLLKWLLMKIWQKIQTQLPLQQVPFSIRKYIKRIANLIWWFIFFQRFFFSKQEILLLYSYSSVLVCQKMSGKLKFNFPSYFKTRTKIIPCKEQTGFPVLLFIFGPLRFLLSIKCKTYFWRRLKYYPKCITILIPQNVWINGNIQISSKLKNMLAKQCSSIKCLCRFATGIWVLMNSRMSVVTLQELFPSIIFPWQSNSLGRRFIFNREKKTTDKFYNIFSSPIQREATLMSVSEDCRMYLITEFETRKSHCAFLTLYICLLFFISSRKIIKYSALAHTWIYAVTIIIATVYPHEWCSKTNSEPTTTIVKKFRRILKSAKPNQFKLIVENRFLLHLNNFAKIRDR